MINLINCEQLCSALEDYFYEIGEKRVELCTYIKL